MKSLVYRWWLACALALTPAALSAQLLARQYRANVKFSGHQLQAKVRVRVHTTAPTRVVTFSLARSLRLGDVAIEGQTYRAAVLSPGHYTLLMVQEWPAHTDHEITFSYQGPPPAPDVVTPDEVELSPASGWYPVFRRSVPFTTEVEMHPPAGMQVMTRGELTQEDSSGRQTWVDGQAGKGLGVVWKRGLPQVERDWPGLQLQVFCPELAEPACSTAAGVFGDAVWADYRQLSSWYGQPTRSRIIPVVLSSRVHSLEGSPSLYFAPPPDKALGIAGRMAMASSLSRLWWNFSETAPADRWLELGLPMMTALTLERREGGRSAEIEGLNWLQEEARRERVALTASAPGEAPVADLEAWGARAAMVLNALRMQVGTQSFLELMTAFDQRSWQHPGEVTTRAFEQLAGQITHNQLNWFWQQWLERPELPHIEFSWRRIHLPRSGQTVRVQVEQKAPSFGFRAPIVIVAGGHRYDQFIEVHNRNTILGIPVRGKIDSVAFDPGHELLRAAEEREIRTGKCPPASRKAERGGHSSRPVQAARLTISRRPGCSSR